MKKTYYVDGNEVTVDEKDEQKFNELYPNAEEKQEDVLSYNVDGNEVTVDANDNDAFQELYPDAQPSAGNAESSTESVNGELKNYKAHNQFNDSEFASENIL